MAFTGFTSQDFATFNIDGLTARMTSIEEHIRPKFRAIAEHITPLLTELSGIPFYSFIAKHARRTVNPPKDTWIAFAPNKRGYKMLPHFQVGLWETHVFILFAIIYECPTKKTIAANFMNSVQTITKRIPSNYYWSVDHTKPDTIIHHTLSESELHKIIKRMSDVKQAELLCGLTIANDAPILSSPVELMQLIENTIRTLYPLYQLSMTREVRSITEILN
jgi:uncharacterized protein YktB (UPF0637 family)